MNPWEVGTLEWTVASPPPHHNFDRIPLVVRGPHELAHPAARSLGRDWLGQAEIVDDAPAASPTPPAREPA
jgi:cytochrome c oxidase subunit 1